jgi:hypothetical protein
MSDRFAAVRPIEREIAQRACLIWKQPWRVFRNRRLRREVRELHARFGEEMARVPKRRTRPQTVAVRYEP